MYICIQSTKQYRYIAGELGILHRRVQGHEREREREAVQGFSLDLSKKGLTKNILLKQLF